MNPWLSALLYGLPSFGCGVLAGWTLRREVTQEVSHMVTTPSERRRRHLPDRALLRRGLAVLAAVVLIITFASTLLVIHQQKELDACIRASNAQLVNRLNDAGVIAKDDRDAVANMVATVIHAKTRQESAAALNGFLAQKEKRDKIRASLPPYPSIDQSCPSG